MIPCLIINFPSAFVPSVAFLPKLSLFEYLSLHILYTCRYKIEHQSFSEILQIILISQFPYVLSLNHGVYIIEKGYKKTVCPDGKYFHQNKLFFIFTLIIFSEHSYFLRKSQITPERKQRKKIFFNSICTPLEHPDSPQSLYLWAFSQFSPLLELNSIYGCR